MRTASDTVLLRMKIEIDNLDFYCGRTKALIGMSLCLPEKRVTGLIGPFGCGKSTVLRVLNRLYGLYPGQRATGVVLFWRARTSSVRTSM